MNLLLKTLNVGASCINNESDANRTCQNVSYDDFSSLFYEDLLFRSFVQVFVMGAAVVLVMQHLSRGKRRGSKTIKKVPGGLPIIGNPLGKGGSEQIGNKIKEWITKHGRDEDFLECNLFGTRFIITCSNKAMEFLSRHRPLKVRRNSNLKEGINSGGATGVFTAEDTTWAHERRMVSPALNHSSIKEYLSHIKMISGRLVDKWRAHSSLSPSSTVSITGDLLCFSIDIISLMTTNCDFDCLRNSSSTEASDLKEMFNKIGFRGLSPIRYWRIPIVGQYLDGLAMPMNRMRSSLYKFVHLEQKEQEQEQQNGDIAKKTKKGKSTILAKMVAMNNSDEKEEGDTATRKSRIMSSERLYGNILTMFAAGSESTSSTIVRLLWELVNDDTGLLKELADESRAMGDDDFFNGASMETYLRYLPRLRSFFYEINRIKGVAPFLFLENVNELQYESSSIVFPPGTNFILAYSYVASMDPACGVPLGPNKEPPSEFCPRRWLFEVNNGTTTHGDGDWPTKVGVLKPSAKIGIPIASGFGTGARICPGQDLAEMEVLIVVSSLLRAFDISLEENHPPVNFVMRFTVAPDREIRLVLSEAAMKKQHG